MATCVQEDGQAPVASGQGSAIVNGTGRTGTAKATIVSSRPAAVASRQYQPEELGFEVLAAYDQAWAASMAQPANKNGKLAKVRYYVACILSRTASRACGIFTYLLLLRADSSYY